MTFGIQMTAPGQYQATATVPISAVAGLTASLNGTTGWSWSNTVTSYVGYFSAEAGQPAPVSQAPVKAPVTNINSYGFIVGPTGNQQYTVTCTATYPNGSGTATLTFTSSAAPTGSISVTQLGSQTWTSTPGNGGEITLILNPPIKFSFTATNNTNVGGEFALMQIITYTRSTATAGNTLWFKQNNIDYTPTGGPNFNGNLVDGGNWDYEYLYNGTASDSTEVAASQTIPAAGVNAPTAMDNPSGLVPNTINGTTVTAVSRTDNFSLYVMFRSNVQGSVWMAVSQLNWSWSVSVSQQGGAWPNPNPTPQPNPGNSTTPAGTDAFPPWVNTSAAFADYYAGLPWHWRT